MHYRAFLLAQQKSGANIEYFRIGARDQFLLKHGPGAYASFEIHNLAASGEVWTRHEGNLASAHAKLAED